MVLAEYNLYILSTANQLIKACAWEGGGGAFHYLCFTLSVPCTCSHVGVCGGIPLVLYYLVLYNIKIYLFSKSR